ncbi:MAG: hypothetical protein ACYDH9_08360 [Limisphaerales bacterium]
MKIVFAIMISGLLVITQTIFAAALFPASSPAREHCACANCQKACCVSRHAPATPDLPATPAAPGSQNDWQSLAAQAPVSPALPAATPEPFFLPAPPDVPTAVALYQRDCRYRI